MITALAAAYVLLFIACAVTDVLWLRIPNLLVIALAALFAVAAVVEPPASLLWSHIVPAVAAFALTAPLFFWGKFGGGDVKLLSVAVLWVGLAWLGPFLIALAVYGFVALVVFARFRPQVAALVTWGATRLGQTVSLPLSLQESKTLPYGVVIAAAAISIGSPLVR